MTVAAGPVDVDRVEINSPASAQEVAAIVTALELLWPSPVPFAAAETPPSKWRFSSRPWQTPASWPAVRYR